MSDRPAAPLGSAPAVGASIAAHARAPDGQGAIWVLEDARGGGGEPCLAIAERLGREFRRVPLWWNLQSGLARLARRGSLAGLLSPLPLSSGPPVLTISAGRRAAAVASWLKHECGSRMIHYGPAGLHARAADMHVFDGEAPSDGAHLPVLGPPQRLSSTMLHAARAAWLERLEHLPRPRLALLVGAGTCGGAIPADAAYRLASGLAEALHGVRGAILAMTDSRTGRAATDALEDGLGGCLHMLHRGGAPEADPELGFLALADAIVVAGNAPDRLLRACGLAAPIYISPIVPPSPSQRRLHMRLLRGGHARLLHDEIGAWPRTPLDEAGRVAHRIREVLPAEIA